MTHALAPLNEPYPAEVADLLARYPRRDGYLLELFRVFANSARFLRKGVADLLDEESPLPLRLREIVILRVTANLDCEYEWGVHVTAFASHARLTEDQVTATRLGESDSSCWTADESLLIRAVDQLCASGTIEDKTLERFQQAWTAEQQLEIFALCGNYHTICFVANAARLESEAFGATFATAS